MRVIIMQHKHNLEMKHRNGGLEGCVCVCVFQGAVLWSCCTSECQIPQDDVLKMNFLWENAHFNQSGRDLNCRRSDFYCLI